MSDPNPTPEDQPVDPTEPESHASPSDFLQAQLETVRNGESLARSAAKVEHQATLLTEGMLTGTPAALVAACNLWRKLSGNAVDATEERKEATDVGETSETLLKHEVEYYRSKCRLAIVQHPLWTKAEKDALKARYFIGDEIFANEGEAGISVQLLLDHAAVDGLPGVSAEKLAASAVVLKNFIDSPNPQNDAQVLASKKRQEREAAFTEVMRLRHEIQHCADSAYPWWKDENIAWRKEFLLPIGRPLTA